MYTRKNFGKWKSSLSVDRYQLIILIYSIWLTFHIWSKYTFERNSVSRNETRNISSESVHELFDVIKYGKRLGKRLVGAPDAEKNQFETGNSDLKSGQENHQCLFGVTQVIPHRWVFLLLLNNNIIYNII